ncbi:hypothetical protein HPP92_013296 [Vanilla planifolia]|uniref:Uncharacterized protein n=1 Tax=Vanilla planifolia TaxID=51239 RepID=A0A835UXV4_VANPL|nr:hypothetical protein HPP92_013296 [Vanilla planifolia]
MSPGDIAFKGADRHFEEEGPILSAALDGMKLPSYPEYEVRVRYATEHRCDNRLLLKAEALDDTAEAKHTAAVVNELSREISRILSPHPINVKRAAEGKNIANVVLLRGCGIRIEVILLQHHLITASFLSFGLIKISAIFPKPMYQALIFVSFLAWFVLLASNMSSIP